MLKFWWKLWKNILLLKMLKNYLNSRKINKIKINDYWLHIFLIFNSYKKYVVFMEFIFVWFYLNHQPKNASKILFITFLTFYFLAFDIQLLNSLNYMGFSFLLLSDTNSGNRSLRVSLSQAISWLKAWHIIIRAVKNG